MTRRLLDYGPEAVLLECADLPETLRLLPVLRAHPAVTEAVPGARTLLLRLRTPLSPGDREHLLTVPGRELSSQGGTAVTLEVDYSGPDLDEVAELTGLSRGEVVAVHTSQQWTVGFCGFAPGFGYLVGEHERLRVPRRAEPRTRVPAGAVGLAGPWSGVYPRSGPGGWQLLGQTAKRLWDLDQDPPALLQPGTPVRFVAVTR